MPSSKIPHTFSKNKTFIRRKIKSNSIFCKILSRIKKCFPITHDAAVIVCETSDVCREMQRHLYRPSKDALMFMSMYDGVVDDEDERFDDAVDDAISRHRPHDSSSFGLPSGAL